MGARYGQHFLRNRRAIETILARFDPRPEDRVVEIGPGRGTLTTRLAERAGSLAALEIDPVLAEGLARDLGVPLLHGKARAARVKRDAGAAAEPRDAGSVMDASAGPQPPAMTDSFSASDPFIRKDAAAVRAPSATGGSPAPPLDSPARDSFAVRNDSTLTPAGIP